MMKTYALVGAVLAVGLFALTQVVTAGDGAAAVAACPHAADCPKTADCDFAGCCSECPIKDECPLAAACPKEAGTCPVSEAACPKSGAAGSGDAQVRGCRKPARACGKIELL